MKSYYPKVSVAFCVFLTGLFSWGFSQQFNNTGLNGTVGISTTPTNWTQVSNADPNSVASGTLQATSDVTSTTGPSAGSGINCNPRSPSTCVTGLHMSSGGSTWHEGLQQTVAGFTVGQVYNVRLFQTVVKQSNALDQSGGWMLVVNNTVVGITSPSFSTLAYNSNNCTWGQRDLSFTAPTTSITFKFLPMDDDGNISGSSQGLRMGIDDISLTTTAILPWEADFSLSQTQNNSVQLDWDMPEAHHAEQFKVERSPDGVDFEQVQTVQAGYAGSFRSLDPLPYNDKTYYRLQQISQDGAVRFTKIKSITMEVPLSGYVAGRLLRIRGAEPGPVHVQLIDMSGRMIYENKEIEVEEYLTAISRGIYVLRVMQGEKIFQQKVAIE